MNVFQKKVKRRLKKYDPKNAFSLANNRVRTTLRNLARDAISREMEAKRNEQVSEESQSES